MDDTTRIGCFALAAGLIIGLIILAIIGGSLKSTVTYASPQTSNGAKVSFEESRIVGHWLGGLIPGNQLDLNQISSKYNNGQLASFSITTKFTWVNLLVSIVTLFIYMPQTVDITGEIIQ